MNTSHLLPIVRLSIPLIVGQLGVIVQQFADTAMVGHYGTAELSAAGFVGTVFNMFIFFLLGISYSTTPVVGSFFGRGEMAGASGTLRESLLVNLCTAIMVMAPLTWLYFHIELLDQPEELIPVARPYFLTLLLSLPFLSLFNTFKQFSDALGETRMPMWVMLVANTLNIVLNIPLIFGCSVIGVPPLGLLGAGIATLVSRMFMAVAMGLLVFFHKVYCPVVSIPGRVSLRGVWRLWAIGLPISLQLCLETASFNVSGIFMGWIGSVPLAAHQVMCTIATLCFQVVYGIGAAAAVRVSQYAGRNEWDEVRRAANTAFALAGCCILVISSGIVIGIRPLTALFTTSGEVSLMVMALLLPFLFYQMGDCLQIVFANVLRGIARVRTMMWSAFVAYVLVSIPLSYAFAFFFHFGAVGVWWGIPFGLTTAGVLFHREFRKALGEHAGTKHK